METTAFRRRRVGVVCAAVAAAATIGVGVTAAPAGAQRANPCATARAVFHSYMTQASIWINASDRLAAAGEESLANQASDQANYYLGLAAGALDDISAVC